MKRVVKHLTLKRDLGLFQATACGVGIILGAGIYVLVGAASGMAGNAVWISFLIASLVAVFTGLSYAELCSIFPTDAGEYLYVEESFGKITGFFTGYMVWLSHLIGASAVALGFAGYFGRLTSFEYISVVAIAAVIIFSFVNYLGIKQTAWMNILFTSLETFGLLFIIAISIKYFGSVDYFETVSGYKGVFQAASLIFFAYIGFETVIKLSEETKNPKKTIPRALLLSILISTVIYISVAVAAVSTLGWHALSTSSAPLADVARVVFGNKALIMLGVIALFSTGNTVLLSLVGSSRGIYGLAEYNKSLKIFTKVHPKRRTPYIAIIFTAIIAILFILIGNISIVAELTNFMVFITFALVNASLIYLRYKMPKRKRTFKVPLNIGKFPILALFGVLVSIFMLFNLSLNVLLGGAALSAVGFLVYWFTGR